MEGEVGAQVAPSAFFHQHQAIPGPFHEAPLLAKKRDFPWKNNPNFPHGQEQEIQRHRLMGASLPSHGGNWNPMMWDWDGGTFTAKPSTDASEVLHLGSQPSSYAAAAVVDQRKGDEGPKDSTFGRNLAEDDQNLALKLGGGACTVDEPAARPNKRVRSGSPGSSGNYPMCQVDDCKADLSSAKDYHKRHKVCEVHSKTAKALVGKQMQRFCQQCSRFHPLSEFDEGKRSCRRRLAGHNRRRRKTLPEDVSSKLLPPRSQESTTNGNIDIVNLLAIFARLQGNNQVKPVSIPPLLDQDHLVQLISKLSAPNNANPSSRSSVPVGSFDLNVSQVPALESFEQSLKKHSHENAPSTTDLLTALSAALAASAPNAPVAVSQGSSESSGNNKANIQNAEPPTDVNSHNKSTHIHPSVGVLTNKCTDRSGVEVPCRVVQKARQSLPLQLFGPADDESPAELASTVKYLSSESSNPMEERSPSSSPPVTKKLFPLHSTMERQKYAQASECQEDNATIELSVSHGRSAQLQLFKESDTLVEDGAAPSVMRRAAYKSSGSDHSPSSSNSDAQDRTGRITFKLFGKDPSCFPDTLRAQVFSWLSNSPSEMESYIRPGCVVLSIYLSMPSIAWEELEDDLLQRVTSLVQYSDTEFWRNGRFLVSTNKQLVSHKDGKIRLSKTWRAWSAPELTSVSPVAIVGGQETNLVLKGRNLTVPGTKIHCAYMGKYISKVLCSAYPGTIYDDSCVERFDFPGGSPKVFGRCFIEVENGFKGNSFPVIIADADICQELRALESDFDEDVQTADAIPEEQVHSSVQPRSRADVMHFLNELGWLFQRTNASSSPTLPDFSITRFKYLFTFSVERDWCNLIKTLLDILVERSLRNDAFKQESLEMLSEVHLLIRAVNRKSKQMIDLLLHYCVCHGKDAAKVYLFPPNMAGPGGMTPLHMAASMQDAEDIVDALTNDPQEIGIKCWNSILDDNDQSPYMYATLRNNLSYNRLVARKLADRTNGQVTISVEGGEISMDEPWVGGPNRHGASQTSQSTSCSQCALMGARPRRRMAHSSGLLQRPYVHSILAIAAVCVCVCLFFRGLPQIGSIEPFKWENLDFGPR